MSSKPTLYRRHRFPGEIINHAVWLYHLFSLSLRDIELILAERGVVVTREASAAGAASSVGSLLSDCADVGRDQAMTQLGG
jgi:transposase-like protein